MLLRSSFTCILVLFSSIVYGQTTTQKVADYTSTGLVAVNVTLDSIHAYKNHCMKNYLIGQALTVGSSELVKRLVPEERPDGSDNKSFWSEHSSISSFNRGWSFSGGWTVALGAGTLRVVANKHHWWDVGVGLGVGFLDSKLFPCEAQ